MADTSGAIPCNGTCGDTWQADELEELWDGTRYCTGCLPDEQFRRQNNGDRFDVA